MIDGVRMWLFVIVWNITVDAAIANPTITIARTFRPRNGRMKSQFPFAWIVMKIRTTPTAPASRSAKRINGLISRAGNARSSALRTDTGRAPQQHEQEDNAADHADNSRDRDLVRIAKSPAGNVTCQQEASADHGDPRSGPANIVAQHHAHDVRHDEPQERNRPDRHHIHRRHDTDNGEPERQDTAVVQAEVLREGLAQPGDRETVRRKERDHRQGAGEPKKLVP